jgi:hypothetical protein
MSPRPAAPRRILPRSPFNNAPTVPVVVYEVDDRVCHDRHGLGRVIRVESAEAVIVDFRSGETLRVKTPSTKLTKL